LGISVGEETLPSADFFRRLATEPPPIWALGWIADYPGPNDFLGILLRTGATNDYGRWSSPEFDSAINKAGASTDQAAIAAAFDQAQALVQRDVPVVPLAYSTEWALSRQGLLGAGGNGLGFIRLAGLAWSGK
jgi:ABC-type oligopeptide transport system substrate-binding subunit